MIYDHIRNYTKYEGLGALSEALHFISTLDVSSLSPGRIELDGEHMYANVIALTSKAEMDCVFEAHRKYADIHFIISGTEGIAFAAVDNLVPDNAFDENNDIGFYSGRSSGTLFLLAGDFVVCYPGEAHKVAIAQSEQGPITKVVVKVSV
ncbi:YhcH/YjgK/YiaL family protein [Paenibacillus oenotherae]|uniref:YhcH/YjgK/YiaL family protein n=1 Tax=Paenibacillus oenotherae TaxID=1435645 RepID=A0ABS7D735_9BACL|nr:YhcH/YjgK/YiaL family protein [Paenibacillus oenotherae]MBW7475745.1 YhcH/YjgK/YiaL family protein [Paenibacillus oenotherae]